MNVDNIVDSVVLENFNNELLKKYDIAKTNHILMVLLPNIINDFVKSMASNKSIMPISEEYRFEDGSEVIKLVGTGGKITNIHLK